MINVLIVDDHDIIRKGLRNIVSSCSKYQVVGEASNSNEALAKIKELKPDILLLDITMPGESGLDIISQIRGLSENIKIIIISVHKVDPYINKALQLGAKGYLVKDNAAEELILALDRVMNNEIYLGRNVSDSLIKKISSPDERQSKGLTLRDKEILRLVAEGKTAKEIAKTLNLSSRTIENNKNTLLKKLNLHHAIDLVKYALENNIID